MNRYDGIPELLEQFMQEQGTDERWVTVHELCERYGLTRYQCNTVSGFLRRLEFCPFVQFPFIVANIAYERGPKPSDPKRARYLLKRRITRSMPRTRERAVG